MTVPRRKVVASFKAPVAGPLCGYYECTLACGHRVTAYGVPSKEHRYTYVAPKTAGCPQCAEKTK